MRARAMACSCALWCAVSSARASAGHFLGAVEVDLLRPLDRIHQHERLAVLHLEHALGHGGDLLDAVGVPQRQLAGDDGEHDILVLRHQAVYAVDARHGE